MSGNNRLGLLLASMLSLMLVVAACGEDDAGPGDESDDTAQADTDGDEDEQDDGDGGDQDGAEDFPNVVDGVLQPLPSGFPDDTLRLINGHEVGDASDIYLQHLADAAENVSPVSVQVIQEHTGPRRQWETMDWLETQEGGTEGYFLTEGSMPAIPIRYLQVEMGPGHHYHRIQPVILNAEQNFALGVPEDSEFQSVEDLVSFAQDNPGELTIAVLTDSQLELALQLLAVEADFEFRQIPASSPVESVQVMLGGGADAVMSTLEPLQQQSDAGEARILLQLGDQPATTITDVPTSSEMGWDVPLGTRRGLVTHPDVPDEHLQWLYELFRMASQEDAFQQYLEDSGAIPAELDPDEAQQVMDNTHDRVLPIVEDLGRRVEGND